MKAVLLPALSAAVLLGLCPDIARPGIIELPAQQDAYASLRSPETNYGSSNLAVLTSPWDPTWREDAYLQFDISSLPEGAQIDRAELQLYLGYSEGGPAPTWIRRVTQQWDETTLTWNNRPSSDGVNWSTQTVSGAWTTDSWDVTDLVSMWVEQPQAYPNFGMMLTVNPLQGSPPYFYRVITSREHAGSPGVAPLLSVEYTFSAVPEPSSLLLYGLGLACLCLFVRRPRGGRV